MVGVNNVNFKMDYSKYTKEELVTLCDTYSKKIDYLNSLKIHVDLHNVSSMFSEDEVTKLLETQRMNCWVAATKCTTDEELLNKIATAPMHEYSKD